MRFVATVLLGALLATASFAVSQEEAAARARLDSNGHLAKYVLMAVMEYSSELQARKVQEAIARGRLSLNEAMQAQAQLKGKASESAPSTKPGAGGRADADHDPDSKSMYEDGELSADGLMTVDDVHPAIAEVAFDVRNPTVSHASANPLGPMKTGENSYHLAVVFQRYRAGFFSPEWFEAEAFAKKEGLSFKDLLRDLSDEDAGKYLSFQIWPNDDVPIKRIKLKTVQQNLARIGTVADPSAAPQAPNREPPHEDVPSMLDARRRFFEQVPDWVKEEHPEVYSMDLEDVVAAGLGPGAHRSPNPDMGMGEDEVRTEMAFPEDGAVHADAGLHDEF